MRFEVKETKKPERRLAGRGPASLGRKNGDSPLCPLSAFSVANFVSRRVSTRHARVCTPHFGRMWLIVWLLMAGLRVQAQEDVSLEQAGSRTGSDFAAVYEGR